jgi:hypothetical protein
MFGGNSASQFPPWIFSSSAANLVATMLRRHFTRVEMIVLHLFPAETQIDL